MKYEEIFINPKESKKGGREEQKKDETNIIRLQMTVNLNPTTLVLH